MKWKCLGICENGMTWDIWCIWMWCDENEM